MAADSDFAIIQVAVINPLTGLTTPRRVLIVDIYRSPLHFEVRRHPAVHPALCD